MEFLIGMIVGAALCLAFFKLNKKKPSATFVIDFTDPIKDVCRFELEEDLDAISAKKQIIVDVKTLGISQQ